MIPGYDTRKQTENTRGAFSYYLENSTVFLAEKEDFSDFPFLCVLFTLTQVYSENSPVFYNKGWSTTKKKAIVYNHLNKISPI